MDPNRSAEPSPLSNLDDGSTRPPVMRSDWIACIINAIDDAIFSVNHQWQFTYVNTHAATWLGYPVDYLIGKNIWETVPTLVGSPFERLYQQAMAENRPLTVEDFSPTTQAWYSVRAFPTPNGMIGIFHDITARKEAESALQRAKEELERCVGTRTMELQTTNRELQIAKQKADFANQEKSEFLSRMSHELRTPLHGILGFGQLLEGSELTDLQRESVDYILKSGRHLLSLINEILDIARADSGRLEPSIIPESVSSAVAEACQRFQLKAEQQQIRLLNTIDPTEDYLVLADRRYLNQILVNLLDNALKYNRPGGEIVISASQRPYQRIGISIQDTGYGIATDDITRLFNPFERLQATNSTIEGSGLGLTLSQRLATLLGGRIIVETHIGVGSTFTLEIPQSPINPMPDPDLAQDSGHAPTPDGHQPTVLYIEDNPANLRLVEVIFKQRPEITILTAKDGKTGLALAYERLPDLVLLDLHLPDLLGQDVLLSLQSTESTKAIPVVVISADATPVQMERLRASGAQAYLTKPINVSEFLNLIDGIVR